MIKKHEFSAFIFLACSLVTVLSQNSLDCGSTPSVEYSCSENESAKECKTYAILQSVSHFSSLSNLSSYLNISPIELAEANGFSDESELVFYPNLTLLIPLECKCNNNGIFEAEMKKTAGKGESFNDIVESLEGLTTCNDIQERNPSVSPWNLEEKNNLLVPLKCACLSPDEHNKFLLSYPVKEGDTLSGVALEYNVTVQSLVSANDRYSKVGFKSDNPLVSLSTLLIPVEAKPVLSSLAKPQEPDASARLQAKNSHKRGIIRKWMIGVYTTVSLIALLACIAVGVAVFFIYKRKTRHGLIKNGDLELQKLSLSVRTTSDKKVSFEGSQYHFDDPIIEAITPKKMPVENYSFEELQKATEDFSSSNLIGGLVFQGRLKGKIVTIKRAPAKVVSKVDFHLFHERSHRHPNMLRFLGTCLMDGPDSFIVFEYAKNGSLKDWIHGGLAIKSHFIASCNCFLNWRQRLKICLDTATALQFMHHIMNPSYVHRNIRSRNIFLDEDFNAKLGNFGMANCIRNESEDQDTNWNKGYLAPEYLSNGIISTSVDVFAYGVVLLEVLSGKPAIRQDENEEGIFVKLSDEIKHILESEGARKMREWMDCALGDKYSFDVAVMLANLARSCVEEDTSLRPNAGEIVEKLLRLVEEMPESEHFNMCESSSRPLVKEVAKK